jgi:hypothetical protein
MTPGGVSPPNSEPTVPSNFKNTRILSRILSGELSMSDPTLILRRREAAEYLRGKGIPIASPTLAKLACLGGGPPFRKFGRAVLYEVADLNAWANQRMTSRRRSTSDPGETMSAVGDMAHE